MISEVKLRKCEMLVNSQYCRLLFHNTVYEERYIRHSVEINDVLESRLKTMKSNLQYLRSSYRLLTFFAPDCIDQIANYETLFFTSL